MSDAEPATFAFLGVTFYLLLLWLFIVAVQGGTGPRATDAILWGYGVSTAVAGGLGVLAYVGTPGLESLMVQRGRLFGMFKDANVYAAYLVPGVVYAVAVLLHRASRRRAFWVMLLGCCAGGIFLSFSRGAWANLAVSLVILLLLFTFAEGLAKVWWRTAVLFPPLVILLGFGAYELLTLPAAAEMLSHRFGMQGYDSLRFATQARALDTALANPIGVGPGATALEFSIATHSTYVRAWLENGVLGAFSLLTLMLVTAARAVWLSVSSRHAADKFRFSVVAASLCGMFVEAAVIDTIHWRHFWLFLGLAWCPAGPTLRRIISSARIR